MSVNLSFNINQNLFKKNPELSEIGKIIVKDSIELIHDLGFENFTFKKLGLNSGHTEATIYRYFENKQKLLLYLVSWYWFYIDFLIEFRLQNKFNKPDRINEVIDILTSDLTYEHFSSEINIEKLYQIVIREGNRVYFNSEVREINKNHLYKPYKDLCTRISDVITECNKSYPYPKSLSSTILEASHFQRFFSENLPKLTDVTAGNKKFFTNLFLKDLIHKAVAIKKNSP